MKQSQWSVSYQSGVCPIAAPINIQGGMHNVHMCSRERAEADLAMSKLKFATEMSASQAQHDKKLAALSEQHSAKVRCTHNAVNQ